MAHDVFISHSAKDKPTADAVCAKLESRGVRCWMAPRDILPGMEWGEAIVQAIKRSRVMILIFSNNANQSPQIRREVERAVSKEIPIIPFRIENVLPSESLEYYLSTPHWLDALTPPMSKHLQNLVETVKLLLSRTTKGLQDDKPYTSGEAGSMFRPTHAIAETPNEAKPGELGWKGTAARQQPPPPHWQQPPASPRAPISPTPSVSVPKGSKATLALVLGVASLLLCWPAGIIAIVVGNQELKAIRNGQSPPAGQGYAKIGVALGWVALAVMVIAVIVWVAYVVLVGSSRPYSYPYR